MGPMRMVNTKEQVGYVDVRATRVAFGRGTKEHKRDRVRVFTRGHLTSLVKSLIARGPDVCFTGHMETTARGVLILILDHYEALPLGSGGGTGMVDAADLEHGRRVADANIPVSELEGGREGFRELE